MNQQRADEVDAQQVVERFWGVSLEHADKNGGVDYRSLDGQIAVEVTRVTDGRREAGRKALRKSRDAASGAPELQTCWLVFVSDLQRGMKTFRQRAQKSLVQLEEAGEQRFDDQIARVHVLQNGPLTSIYQPLLQAGVKRATAVPSHRGDPGHAHRVIPSRGSGGSVSGSAEALESLEEELRDRTDNFKKLAASGAEQRHLFVWLDDDTAYEIARPLSREMPKWNSDGFSLPSRALELDPAVTHLWVVHERSRLGWLWDGETWKELENLGP